MHRYRATLISWSVLLSLAVLSQAAVAQNPCFEECKGDLSEKGCKSPAFDIKTTEGEQFSLEKLAGSVVVLNFWFIACKPCVEEIPTLNQLVDEYQGKEVVFLALTPFDSPKEIKKKFVPTHSFKYKLVNDKNQTWRSFCVSSFPSHYLIDQHGKVKLAFSGKMTDKYYKMMTTAIDNSLSAK